jgi:iron complex outermembrane receptor protein
MKTYPAQVVFASLILLAVSNSDAAADSQATRDPAAGESTALDEVTVTARRRAESLQDVPVAVSVLTGEKLEDAGVARVADYVKFVPNVTYESGLNLGQNRLTIRGLSQVQGGEPPAAILVDGVPLISQLQFNTEQFDLQQIEVLRGPQGAVYGRNAIAGAINITTRRPTNELEGSVMAAYGRGDEYKGRLSLGGPIVADKLLYTVGLTYTDRAGQLRNTTTGRYTDHYRDVAGRVRLLYLPSSEWEIDLKYGHDDAHGGDPSYVLNPGGQPDYDTARVSSEVIGRNPRRMDELSGKVTWSTDRGSLSLILAYLDLKESLYSDYDFTPLPLFIAEQGYADDGFSQELRFTSPADQRVRWILGAYHLSRQHDVQTTALVDPGLFLNPPMPTGAANFPFVNRLDQNDFENVSGFGQLEVDLTPSLELALALRHDDDRLEQVTPVETKRTSFAEWQPKVTLRYRLGESSSAYGSYGKGFRSGSFNPSGASFGEPVFKAETATTYELGFKSTLLERRLLIDAAAFHTTLQNGQILVLDFATASNIGLNVEETSLDGVELEVMARPWGGLELGLAVGAADAKIARRQPIYGDNKMPRVPDYTASLALGYERPISSRLQLFLQSNYQRLGPTAWDLANEAIREPVDFLNARVGVRRSDGRIAATAWVRNALNERSPQDYVTVAEGAAPSGLDAYYPRAGATYGIEVSARF